WTVVDEEQYASITIWIPLVDTDRANGALRVLPGSHRVFSAPRGPSLPVTYAGQYEQLWEAMELLPLPAGHAFVFSQALLHASHANETSADRVAVTYGLIPAAAQLRFYHYSDDRQLEHYAVTPRFFQEYLNIGERPETSVGALIDRKPFTFRPLTAETVAAMIAASRDVTAGKPVSTDFALSEKTPIPPPDAGRPRPFWQVYTPANVLREIRYRFTGK
ncbi:MAG: phytanoyl-CoA dioxygenase family protein, partial [Lewinella sp.]|nr:phytanoyl-CoA dioxygenase family protein [Lewinella sp.]